MTNWQMFWSAAWRAIRVALGQVIGILITSLSGVDIPYVNISLGVALNALAKFLRDKFKWDWLPL